MNPDRSRANGQALVEFALILILLLLLIFIIIEAGRLFQGWLTVQNSARAAGRFALTGQFETDCLHEFPACLDPRVYSIKEEALTNSAGLSVDPDALVGEPQSFVTEVWSKDEGGWRPDFAGQAGKPVRVRVTYHMPLVTPLFTPIIDSIGLFGQVLVTNENFDQVSSSLSQGVGPDYTGAGGEEGLPEADVEIQKWVNPTPKVPTNDPLTYTMQVTNNGPSTFFAENITVLEALPADVSYVSSSVSGGGHCDGPDGSNQLTCYLPNLTGDGGSQSSASITVHGIAPSAAGFITNTATVSTGPSTQDPNLTNNTSSAMVEVIPRSDLGIVKTASPDPSYLEYTTITYGLDVSNGGPEEAIDVLVTDDLPTQVRDVTAVSTQGNCSVASTTVSCDFGDLAVGASGQVTITLVPTMIGPLINQTSVTGNVFDANLSNNQDSIQTTVLPMADMGIIKRGPDHIVYHGDPFTYTIEVANHGPSVATNVTIVDTLPPDVNYVSDSHGCLYNAGNHSLSCDTFFVIPGTSIGYIEVTANDPGPTTNEVTISANEFDPPDGQLNRDTADVFIHRKADLEITKTASDPAYRGEELTYSLVVTNHGPSQARNVFVVDPLPADVTYVSSWSDDGFCWESDGNVFCWLGWQQNGEVANISIVVIPEIEGDIENEASVSSDDYDPDLTNNSAVQTTKTTVLPASNLEITKVAAPKVDIVDTLFYTVEVVNNGPSLATGVVITDTLPVTVDYVSDNSSCNYITSSRQLICNLPNLASGSAVSVTIDTQPNMAGDSQNSAESYGAEYDPDTSDNIDTADTLVVEADLLVTKSAQDPAYLGEDLTYTIVITNSGPTQADNVTITDTLPISVTYLSNNAGCSYIGLSHEVVCDQGTMMASGVSGIDIVVTPKELGAIENSVVVSTEDYDPDLSNNTYSFVNTILPAANLGLTKIGPPIVSITDTITYTLAISNIGPSLASNVIVTDTLPLSVTVNSIAPSNLCLEQGGSLVCDLGDIPAGSGMIIDIDVTPDIEGLFVNTAAVMGDDFDPDPSNNVDFVATTVQGVSDLSIFKDAPANVFDGDTFIYTLVITNAGPSKATNVFVFDSFPGPVGDTDYISSSPECSRSSGGAICSLPSLAVSASATFTIEVVADSPGISVNIADVLADQIDPNLANNSDNSTTDIEAVADLRLRKRDSGTAFIGEPMRYTLAIKNLGPSNASGVVVSDVLPSEVTPVTVQTTRGTCSIAGLVVTCIIGNMNSDARARVNIDVIPTASGDIVNTAEVGGNEFDPDTTNNSDDETTSVLSSAELEITKSGPVTATLGSTVQYTLDVTNNGPSQATDVTIADTLPGQVSFVSATSGCTESGGTVTCLLSSLSATATSSFNVFVQVDQPGTIINTAIVSANEFDSDLSNNSDDVLTTVPAADLWITKSAPASVSVGDSFEYRLDVTNNGPSSASGIILTDILPAGVTYNADDGGCTYSGAGYELTCPINGLAPSGSASIIVDVTATQQGTLVNNAQVSGAEQDPNLTNNSDSTSTAVTEADLSITKSAPLTATVGVAFNYTIEVSNGGPTPASGVIVVDSLPSAVSYVSDDGGCNYNGGSHSLTCNLGSLAATDTISVIVTVVPDQPGSILNTADVSGDDYDPDTDNNTDTVGTTALNMSDLDVEISAPVSSIVKKKPFTITIGVNNNGPHLATGIVLNDSLQITGLTFHSASTGCSFNSADSTVVCDIGSLAASSSVSVDITIDYFQQGSYQHSAEAYADELDPNLANNANSDTIVITNS